MKSKIILTVIIVAVLMGLVLPLNAIAFKSGMPVNPHNFQYWIRYKQSSTQTSTQFIWSAEPLYFDGAGVRCNGEVDHYFASSDTAAWTNLNFYTPSYYNPTQMYQIYEANYSIGSYVYEGAEIVIPEQINYTFYPDIHFTYYGLMTSEIAVVVSFMGANNQTSQYIVPAESIDYTVDGQGFIPSAEIPWGINGTNTVEIKSADLETQYDVQPVVIDSTQSVAVVTGIEDGASYDKPPSLTVKKSEYPDLVALYVNGEKYREFKEATKSYLLMRDYIDNLKVGQNSIVLRNETTSTNIQTVDFTMKRGSVDANGNFVPDGGSDNGGSALQELEGVIPQKSGPDASVIDWIKYVGLMIDYVFNIVIATLKDFASQVGSLLSSLFDMIRPVITFVQIMFQALPSPLVTGIMAVFVLGCVLAIIKMIRGA